MRDTFSICFPLWSSICESSMMMRLMNPRSTRPTLTFVPNFSDNTPLTHSPIAFCMKGMCKRVTIARYRPAMAHTIILIVRLNTCGIYSLSLLNRLQNYVKSLTMANKSAEKPYYVSILYHRAPNGIRSDGSDSTMHGIFLQN